MTPYKKRFGKRSRGGELAPEDIFLDSSNLPDFDRGRLEGRLEKPIGERTYLTMLLVIGLALTSLVAQAANLQVMQGAEYAQKSERNRLRPETVFAERGAVLDRNGVPLIENEPSEDGFVRRVYKAPGFAHLLGYVSYPKKDSSGRFYEFEIEGLAGVEEAFDEELSGENGKRLIEEDALGAIQSEGSVVPAVPGRDLRLSIDARAQEAFASAVAELADRIPFLGGAAVLIDVETGEIRALVSYPEYDPNVLSRGDDDDAIAGYASDERRPYLDRAVSGLYTPGSIVKPMIIAGALEDGVITPSTTIVSEGQISIPNPYDPEHPSIFRDWKAHGATDARGAIAVSSDVYFYAITGGYRDQEGLGIERLAKWYRAFGFESLTGIELAGEASGFVPTPAWKEETYGEEWRLGNTYHTGIGQYAMQITPLEAVRAIAAIANGGKLVEPTVLAGEMPSGESLVIDAQSLKVVRDGMRQGVEYGTSVGLNDLSFVNVAGKTGTAQLGANNEWYNSWAVGFFPYEHPKYAYAVVMERGPAGNGIGGIYVMHQALTKLNQTAPEYFALD
jgi:penicillin-binding protein 2